ncbi:MAG TPA: hypothetical protein GXX18_20105, partial [Bacillales bacterium]|nr:hypothetical protein [Bacillales bacterium]
DYHDTFDDALKHTITETYKKARNDDFKYEYSSLIYQFPDYPNRYYAQIGDTWLMNDRVYYKPRIEENPDINIIAGIHTHPYETQSVFTQRDVEFNRKHNAHTYVIEPLNGDRYNKFNVYVLEKDKTLYDKLHKIILD